MPGSRSSIQLCANKSREERRHNDSCQVRHVQEKRTRNCTRSRYKKRRSGKRHSIVEGFSRRPDATKADSKSLPKVNAIDRINEDSSSEGVETSSARESLIEQQQSDPELSRIVQLQYPERPTNEQIEGESEPTKKLCNNWDALEVHDDLVYRKFVSKRTGEPKVLQLLVPRCQVAEVLRQCHTGTVNGNFGIKRTLDQVQRRFYWSTWKSDTERYCRHCEQCATYHRGKLRCQAPLRPVISGASFERWYIDLTVPHPKSDNGHVYILTCVDAFTKWAEAFPLRNKEDETVAKVLVEQLFCRFGTSLSILSDQRIMREICRMFDVDKLRTSPYKPSTIQVECLQRTLNTILSKTVEDHQRDWDRRLPCAMAAYRASRHENTGYSPNFLTLGREFAYLLISSME